MDFAGNALRSLVGGLIWLGSPYIAPPVDQWLSPLGLGAPVAQKPSSMTSGTGVYKAAEPENIAHPA